MSATTEPPTGGWRVCWEPRTLYDVFEHTARRLSGDTAVVCSTSEDLELRVTYGELLDQVDRLAAGLVAMGVRPGDRVAIWMTNLPTWIVVFFATTKLGAVLVPINTFYQAGEVQHVLKDSGARHLLVLGSLGQRDFPRTLAALVPDLEHHPVGALHVASVPELRTVVVVHRPERGGDVPDGPLETFGQVCERGDDPAWREVAEQYRRAVRPEHLASIKYTGGSSGFPKGVMLRHSGLVTVSELLRRRLEMTDDDRFYMSLPMFHAGGSVWGMLITLLGGGRLVFTEIPNPRRTLDLMEQERCTLRFALAPMYLDELEVPGIEDRTFHLRGLKGGPPNLAERMRRAYQVEFLFSPYGMSEAYGPVCLQGLDAPLGRQAGLSQGRPLDGNEVRIVDPESWAELPTGAVGEICMRGLVMDGYWGNPAATAATIDPDGWLHSGDLGQLDEDGYLTYLGRHKMMLKVGGENASPEEIESCIREIEGVHESAVVGVPDDRFGEVPWAYVVADANRQEDAVIAWCRTHVAAFKVPRAVRFVPRLPVLGNGKLDRSGLAKAAAAEAATTVGRVP